MVAQKTASSSRRAISVNLGPIKVPFESWDTVGKSVFPLNAEVVGSSETFMDELRKAGDSVGAKITTVAGACAGQVGRPVYAKLDADLAGP